MSTTMYSVREIQAPPPGHTPGPIHPPGHPPTSRYEHLHRPHGNDPCMCVISLSCVHLSRHALITFSTCQYTRTSANSITRPIHDVVEVYRIVQKFNVKVVLSIKSSANIRLVGVAIMHQHVQG